MKKSPFLAGLTGLAYSPAAAAQGSGNTKSRMLFADDNEVEARRRRQGTAPDRSPGAGQRLRSGGERGRRAAVRPAQPVLPAAEDQPEGAASAAAAEDQPAADLPAVVGWAASWAAGRRSPSGSSW